METVVEAVVTYSQWVMMVSDHLEINLWLLLIETSG
jgi:hypothetical protein